MAPNEGKNNGRAIPSIVEIFFMLKAVRSNALATHVIFQDVHTRNDKQLSPHLLNYTNMLHLLVIQ